MWENVKLVNHSEIHINTYWRYLCNFADVKE